MFLWWFGFWLGDGHVCSRTGSAFITQFKEETKIKIRAVSEKLGLTLTEHRDGFMFAKTKRGNKELCKFLAPLSVGAKNKYLPDWCFLLSINNARALLDGLVASDGHTRDGGFKLFTTSSVKLRDNIMVLLLNCGYCGTYVINSPAGRESTTKDGRVIKATVINWRVYIVTGHGCHPTVNSRNQDPADTERIVKYTGTLHSIQVRTGLFYVRNNGRGYWTASPSGADPGKISYAV